MLCSVMTYPEQEYALVALFFKPFFLIDLTYCFAAHICPENINKWMANIFYFVCLNFEKCKVVL